MSAQDKVPCRRHIGIRSLGKGADTADAAIEAISLAISLAITIVAQHPNINAIHILSTNAQVPALCANRSHRDHAPRLLNLSTKLADLFDRFPLIQTLIGWTPITKGLLPIRRLKSIAATQALQSRTFPLPPPSKALLRSVSQAEATALWQERWRNSLKLQPAYLALSSPPDGKVPPFIQGLTGFSRPIFTTGIRLLTNHAFTGDYNTRHRPRSNDPHSCPCGKPLQTVHHVIATCPTFTVARRRHFHPLSPFTSLSIIFGTKEGGAVLGAFIAETQACMRPRR